MATPEVKRERLEQLFSRADLPREWLEKHFEGAYIEKIQVSLSRKTWTLFLCLKRPVPPHIWKEVESRLGSALGRAAGVSIRLRPAGADPEQLVRLYWEWIRKKVAEDVSAAAAGWMGRAEWRWEKDGMIIAFPHPMMAKMAEQKRLGRVIASLIREVSGTEIRVSLESRSLEEEQSRLREQQQAEERKLKEQALVERESASAPKSALSPDGDLVIGYAIREEPVPIRRITEEERRVVLKGEVFKAEIRELRSGRTLLTFNLTDFTDSIQVKMFARDKEDAALLSRVKDGMWVIVRGSVQYDNFARELVLIANDLNETEPVRRVDNAEEKRVELHLHTAMSNMDGVSDPGEVVKRAAEWGHPAVAITDHGVVQAFPEAYAAAKKHGIKVIYGVEAYLVDDGVPIVMRPAPRNLAEDTYVVFDVETTGLSAVHDTIIELAAVKVRGGEIVDRFSSFANPHR
ncbi:MAG: PHP domain-containing protein, partial [Planifilum fulgidum]